MKILNYCENVGKMLNPLKEQIKELRNRLNEVREASSNSGFASVGSGSPDQDDQIKEMHERVNVLGCDLREELNARLTEVEHRLERSVKHAHMQIQTVSNNTKDRLDGLTAGLKGAENESRRWIMMVKDHLKG